MVDCEQRPEYLDFVNMIVKTNFRPETSRTIAAVNGKILGVVVFSRFSEFNCEWTAASVSSMFLRPPFIQACFRYAFIQCALKRVSAIVDERNTRSQRLLTKLGFTKEAELEAMFGDSNGILYKMLKPQCRWING